MSSNTKVRGSVEGWGGDPEAEAAPTGRGGGLLGSEERQWGGGRFVFHSEVTESYKGWAWSSHFPLPKFFLIT